MSSRFFLGAPFPSRPRSASTSFAVLHARFIEIRERGRRRTRREGGGGGGISSLLREQRDRREYRGYRGGGARQKRRYKVFTPESPRWIGWKSIPAGPDPIDTYVRVCPRRLTRYRANFRHVELQAPQRFSPSHGGEINLTILWM